ncbi:hypothetical protein [Peribacillus frigoritolerans]|uniref:hypothetical protein n=1 Tax=Peribacillus frigoritolerans TaxID=450367 RepID=UPI0033061578
MGVYLVVLCGDKDRKTFSLIEFDVKVVLQINKDNEGWFVENMLRAILFREAFSIQADLKKES